MLTVLLLFCMLLVLAFVVAVLTGIITISPLILIIIALPALDIMVFKKIFKKKKK